MKSNSLMEFTEMAGSFEVKEEGYEFELMGNVFRFRELTGMMPKQYRQKENKERQETKDYEHYRISGGK